MAEFELEFYEMQEKYQNLQKEFTEYKSTSEEFEIELEKENNILTNKIDTLNKEIINIKSELKKFKERNLEKLNEMELFQKDIDKQKQIVDKVAEEKLKLEKRIVLLENDNSDYMNKIRELECWSEELRRKLDATLEENIVQNTDYDGFKSDMEVTLQRLKQELEEAKNEISSKETIIGRMTEQRDLLVKQARRNEDEEIDILNKNKLIKNVKKSKGNFELSYSANEDGGNYKNDSIIKSRVSITHDPDVNQACLINNVNTPLNKNEKIQTKLQKSCLKLELSEPGDKENTDSNQFKSDKNVLTSDVNGDSSPYNNMNTFNSHQIEQADVDTFIKSNEDYILNSIAVKAKQSLLNNSSFTHGDNSTPIVEKNKDIRSSFVWNENVEDEKEFIKNKIELEIKNILDNRRSFMQHALIQENFSFDFVTNKIRENNLKNHSNFNKKKLLKNIDEMLNKIQDRKEKIITQKILLENKIEKVGVKIF